MDPKSTNDLTGMVSKILAHPELVKEISSLLTEKSTQSGTGTVAESTEQGGAGYDKASAPEGQGDTTASGEPTGDEGSDKEKNRRRLLSALRPFLSERRARVLDSVETVAALLELRGR